MTKDKTKAVRQTMTIGAAHQQKGGRIQAGGQASRKKNHQDENGFADPLELYMTRKMPNNAASFTQKDCANGVNSATLAIPRRASPGEILGSSKDKVKFSFRRLVFFSARTRVSYNTWA